MNRLERALLEVSKALDRAGKAWALVGGLAVSARAEPRFTRDLDLAVSVADDRDSQALVRSLVVSGFKTVTILEQTAVGRLATVRLWVPDTEGEGILADLLFASSGIEPEVVASSEVLEITREVRVPVARTGHLLALKVLSRDDEKRPQDLVDLRSLLKVANQDDRALARAALALIEDRGFARGKDLLREFEALAAGA